MRALGLMSGTSMDGVDVALIDTDGEDRIMFGSHRSYPYSADDRDLLRQALVEAVALRDRTARPGCLQAAEAMVTDRHLSAVTDFLEHIGEPASSIDVVGFHGQTVFHRPDRHLTIQIGNGARLAAGLGVPVVSDLRAADVAAGGQGAPMVPVYHRALAARQALRGPIVVLNIGGVANLSFLMDGRDPIACDTGPGNALLDDLMLKRTGTPCDRDGMTAARGCVDEAALGAMLAHPFFALPAPKSLDRNAFSAFNLDHLRTEDAAATLAAFTAGSIALGIGALPAKPEQVIVCGGGGRNPSIMAALAARLSCPVVAAESVGWSSEAMEAQAFAYLAVRSIKNLPISFPGTTGIATPLCGGRLDRP